MKLFFISAATACLLTGCLKIENRTTNSTSDKVSIGDTKTGSGNVTEVQTIVTGIPSGQVELESHGKEVGLAYGAIAGTNTTVANGIATAHYLEDGATVMGIQANIAVPDDGFFYEVWLSTGDVPEISIGHLTNPLNDVRHNLRFMSRNSLQNYKTILITKEADDGNPGATEVVAIAILKPTSR